jgi:hypothetical protein
LVARLRLSRAQHAFINVHRRFHASIIDCLHHRVNLFESEYLAKSRLASPIPTTTPSARSCRRCVLLKESGAKTALAQYLHLQLSAVRRVATKLQQPAPKVRQLRGCDGCRWLQLALLTE